MRWGTILNRTTSGTHTRYVGGDNPGRVDWEILVTESDLAPMTFIQRNVCESFKSRTYNEDATTLSKVRLNDVVLHNADSATKT
jgi:hypothetical protein